MFTSSDILQPDRDSGYTYFRSTEYSVYIMQFYAETEFGERIYNALDKNELLRRALIRGKRYPISCPLTNYFYNISKNELMIEARVNDNTFDIIKSYTNVIFAPSYEEPYRTSDFFRMSLDIYLRNL